MPYHLYNIELLTKNQSFFSFFPSVGCVPRGWGRISIMELNQIKGECELDLVTDGAVEIKGSLRMEATAACSLCLSCS